MQLDDFDFELPEGRIARFPLEKRSDSRLMLLDRMSGEHNHAYFKDLADRLNPNDLLVFNNTRVIPARLFGRKETGGQVEILIERVTDANQALVHLRASRSPKAGSRLLIGERHCATVIGRNDALFVLQFDEPVEDVMQAEGHMPLPPYMNRADEALDQERYQTVYASRPGAVAAPTAGLHFDETMLDQLKKKGVEMAFVTLHVGAGTFQPVKVDNVDEHTMHSEYVEVDTEVYEAVERARRNGGRVIAVGTTSVRALESAHYWAPNVQGDVKNQSAYHAETDIFIRPGYKFRVVDALITNFHLPKSTLLMLVSALASRESILSAYREAVSTEYRFFSYGDAMFIS